MKFAIFCTDKPESAAIRTSTRPAHLEYVRAVLDRVVLAGPTLSEDGERMTGSLLIMEFDDLAAAQDFADNDPYYKAGLFDSVVVRPWKQVLPEA